MNRVNRLPLKDVRVVDLTRAWAGPYATKILGDMGAEVIKIEAPFHPDGRVGGNYFPDNEPGEHPWNRNGVFAKNNRSKMDIALDLRQPEGKQAIHQLIAMSDLVVENYTPRVMAQLGLSYADLVKIKPDIILVSMPGFGKDGPERDWVAYGTTLDSHCGLTQITGYVGGPPHRMAIAIGDPVGGMFGSMAMLFALHQRRRTGMGQHVDLAQAETLTQFMGAPLADWSMNRRLWPRLGNRDPVYAPQGVYQCVGIDQWVALSIRDDSEWQALCTAINHPELIERFSSIEARRSAHDEIDGIIAEWTRRRTKTEVMESLQQAGVPAGAVLSSKDLLFDPHLRQRGFFEVVDDPETGPRPQLGMSWKLSETPGHITRPAPRFAEHNRHVFGHLIGLHADVIDGLYDRKVTSDEPLMERRSLASADLQRWKRIGLISEIDPDYRSELQAFYQIDLAAGVR
jgi:crotonobetainyl-CoA:carnitine CoA-transferase CaiB-like acyl-CoA transferase